MPLSPTQTAAISHVEAYAQARSQQAKMAIEEVRAMSDISPEDLAHAVHQIKTQARVALHFHPDRLNVQGQSVAEALLAEGYYRNQFETGLSNGKLSPLLGGPRDVWENSLFGGAFAAGGQVFPDRPKYGALDLMRHPDGPAPRFGSCYLMLKPEVSRRATFTYTDSHKNPPERGTLQVFEDILAALLTECFERDYALGESSIRPPKLVEQLRATLADPYTNPGGRPAARNLNHYIEAQVHGPVKLETDAEALVADPSFRGSRTGEWLIHLCKKWEIRLFWHEGFYLPVSAVPTDFRGPTMRSLAQRVAPEGWLNARLIGEAAAEVVRNPAIWHNRGSQEHCLHELKLLWHVLVQYGSTLQDVNHIMGAGENGAHEGK